jgi:hypothetical protein
MLETSVGISVRGLLSHLVHGFYFLGSFNKAVSKSIKRQTPGVSVNWKGFGRNRV